ncbi:MAG TPA: excinuclease ABC subunit UvrA [Candidatus Limnocylindrales bacterium]|nr:excinuclease ABC subunit UvrA [Candidatus Limnocylindrales bacterium]
MPQDQIVVRGAREHNLKNVDVSFPRDRLVVITGLSGSGKSSLAFDTIYAEGQRRYVESLSAYARQFLGQMEKPDVDQIDGLSPAISIDQKGASRNPRSTVGTVTEIYDHLRLLFARIGIPHCPNGHAIERQSIQQIVDQVLAMPEGTRLLVLGPLIKDRKTEGDRIFEAARKQGFVRIRVDGETYDLGDAPTLDKYKRHSIEVVVDRFIVRRAEAPDDWARDERGRPIDPETKQAIDDPDRPRLADSIETALRLGEGVVLVAPAPREGEPPEFEERRFSERYSCPYDGTTIDELEPRSFSFNSPHGACPTCTGLGTRLEIDPELVLPDKSKSVMTGAAVPWARMPTDASWRQKITEAIFKSHGWDPKAPLRNLPQEAIDYLLFAPKDETVVVRYKHERGENSYRAQFEGVVTNLERRYRETDSDYIKAEIEKYMVERPCPTCKGKRLRPEALGVTVDGKDISEIADLSILDSLEWARSLPTKISERERTIAHQLLKEIRARLGFLVDVGLDYLTVNRTSQTLSGGEAQRIRLATQIGTTLMGVLYILDEPSIGLHQRDNAKLIATLTRLRDLGNTVLVVEHDEETIRTADWVVDIGPGAGEHGGEIVANGRLESVLAEPRSITGAYLRGDRAVPVPEQRRKGNGKTLEVKGAREHNLRGIDVTIPLGTFTAVTGVSGSGKSTLVTEVLYRALARELFGSREPVGKHDSIEGLKQIDKVIEIDQSPIGRTPRSNPATYVGLFTPIRERFAGVPEARVRGYGPGRFSFNVKGGRCENCKGDGIIKIEMQFLPDVYVPCEVCKGARYNREALEIHYKGRSIADVLEMTVEEALEFFRPVPNVAGKLQTLFDVGLGYIHLGQPATTLSGGEAQRVKLSTELSRRATGKTLYVLDEPTTGLHFADVEKLLQVLHRIVDTGNTVVVIEHNLDVIKTADWIIDLGPEGGARGGKIVAKGTPEQVAATRASATGEYLARVLRGEPLVPLSDVSFAEAAGRSAVRAVAVPIDPDGRDRADSPGDAAEPSTNGTRRRASRGGVPAAR